MPRRKLEKIAQVQESDYVLTDAVFIDENGKTREFNWNIYFENSNPITLEVGCGRGEYTITMAQLFPEQNFIGIDVKGDRLWNGAKQAEELQLTNVAFIRSDVLKLTSFFNFQQIQEIWITFPDPQAKNPKFRLTHPRFLEIYKCVLQENGFVRIKTDDVELVNFTNEVLASCGFVWFNIPNVYEFDTSQETFNIQTQFEKKYLAEGKIIQYLKFQM